MRTIKAHFDGSVIIPDEPVDLPMHEQFSVDVPDSAEVQVAYMTGVELAESDIVGAWANRDDIGDSVDFVNTIRGRLDRREL